MKVRFPDSIEADSPGYVKLVVRQRGNWHVAGWLLFLPLLLVYLLLWVVAAIFAGLHWLATGEW